MAKLTKKSEQRIRRYLEAMSNDDLVGLVMDRVHTDEAYRRSIEMRAQEATGDVDPALYRRAISQALTSGSANRRDGPRTSGPWARDVHAAIEPVHSLLAAGQGEHVISITEYAIGRIDKVLGRVDDSSGWFADIVSDLERLHHAACVVVRPDPVKLAKRLFAYDVDSDWDLFIDFVETYDDVLGEPGRAAVKAMAEEMWADLPPAPGWGHRDNSSNAFRLGRTLCSIADLEGDVDTRVRVMSRDLSHPYHFLQIAEVLAAAGRDADALEWAERGMDGPDDMPDHMRSDTRLDDFVLDAYARDGRSSEVVALVWRRFAESPDARTYARVKARTEPLDVWSDLRVEARDVLRERAEAAASVSAPTPTGRSHPGRRFSFREQFAPPAYDTLIAVLTMDGDLDEAWELLAEHGAGHPTARQLADASEHRRPLDAARVYRQMIEGLIGTKTTNSYREAVERIVALRDVYERADRLDLYDEFRDDVARRHKPKVKFMKFLNEADA